MLLFKPEFVGRILSGHKTQTRRYWKACRCKTGDIVNANAHVSEGTLGRLEFFAKLRVTGVRQEYLFEISEKDVKYEGYYDVIEFIDDFKNIYTECRLIDKVWVIDFEVVNVE